MTVEVDGKRKVCNSYVRGMVDALRVIMSVFGGGFTTCKDITGTDRAEPEGQSMFDTKSPVGATAWGPVVGTGTTPVAITQTALTTQIGHGVGAGQLQYGAVSVGLPQTLGSTRQFTIARTFTNNSGADITVNEVGLYSRDLLNLWYYMLERTLLTFTIPNGESKTVTYTIKVTV